MILLSSCEKEDKSLNPNEEGETLEYSKEIRVYTNDNLYYTDYVISSNSETLLNSYLDLYNMEMKLGNKTLSTSANLVDVNHDDSLQNNKTTDRLMVEHLGSNYDGVYTVSFRKKNLKSEYYQPIDYYLDKKTKEEYLYVCYYYISGDMSGIRLMFKYQPKWYNSWHLGGWEWHYGGTPGFFIRFDNPWNGDDKFQIGFELYTNLSDGANYDYLYGNAEL